MTIRPRAYQLDAVRSLVKAHDDGLRRPAVVMATGAGKTISLAELVRVSQHAAAGGKRSIVVAHREELVEQNAQKIRDVAPDLRVGVVMAGRNETQGHVISASLPTLVNPLRRGQIRDVGLLIYDECHHAVSPSAVEVMRHFGCYGDGARAAGFTATMARGDSKALGDVWQDVVYVKDTAELIAEGFLVRPVAFRVRVDDLDLSKVRKVAGDFSAAGVGRAVEDSLAPAKIVEAMREHAADRQTILFAPLVHTAEVIRDALREGGFTAEVVSGKTPKDERRRILDRYRAGEVQVLCNAMVFTEGTDLPMTSCVVVARPTMNAALFIQMVGRGLRLWPGKTDCVVLDVVGATGRHRLAAPVELWGEGGVELEDAEPREIDDEALDDLEEQQQVDALFGLDEPVYRDGKLVTEVVDLFEGSDAGWLRTYAGVWFIATATRYVAVLPRAEGGYAVVAMHKMQLGDSRWVMEHVSEIGTAMAHASGEVEGELREAWGYWRGGRPALVRKADQLGLFVPPGTGMGEVKKMITVGLASARIDANLPRWVRR